MKLKDILRPLRRPSALAMAVAILATTIPASPAPMVTVAYALNETPPTIEFVGGETTTATTVITGSFVDILQTYTDGTFVSNGTSLTKGDGLIFLDSTGNGVTITKGITAVSPSNRNMVTTNYEIGFDRNFNPSADSVGGLQSGDPRDEGSGQYSIRGTYNTFLSDALIAENGTRESRATVGNSTHPDVDVVTILQTSRIRIKCDTGEYEGSSGPEFIVLKDTSKGGFTPTGIFSPYATSNNIRITVGESTNVGAVTAGRQRTLELTLSCDDATPKTVPLTLYPVLTFKPTDDQVSANGKYRGLDTGTTYNYIQAGTTFDISFEVPESRAILLTVMTPQSVMKELEGEVFNNKNQDYIKLANGEQLEYIESDFQLRYFQRRYNGTFKIDWQWVPTQIQDTQTNRLRPLTDDELLDAIDLLGAVPTIDNSPRNVSAQNPFFRAGLNRTLTQDVTGYLVAVTQYQMNNTYQVTSTDSKQSTLDSYSYSSTTSNLADINKVKALQGKMPDSSGSTKLKVPAIPITIKGTGTAPSVVHKSTVTGTATNTNPPAVNVYDYEVDSQNKPDYSKPKTKYLNLSINPLDMDAFRGGIDGNKYGGMQILPQGPFRHNLQLNMGDNNGAAPYAIVDVTGTVDAVSFEVDGVEPQITTNPDGSKTFRVENPEYALGTGDEGKPILSIKAERLNDETKNFLQTRANVTITFYRTNAAGEEKPNPEATFPILVRTVDNTPGQDNRLKSLRIVDQAGREIGSNFGYNFDPDTRMYNVTIPFRSNAIKLIPSLLDNQATNNGLNPIRMVMTNSNYQALEIKAAADFKSKPTGEYAKYANENYLEYYYRLLNGGTGSLTVNGATQTRENFYIPFYDEDKVNGITEGNEEKTKEQLQEDAKNQMDMVGSPYTITITPPSHDPRPEFWQPDYVLRVTRALPSEDDTLKSLGVYLTDDGPNLITDFNPLQTDYSIKIPFSTQSLKILPPEPNDPAASDPEFRVQLFDSEGKPKEEDIDPDKGPRYQLEGKSATQPSPKVWLHGIKEMFSKPNESNAINHAGEMVLTFTVRSEAYDVMGTGEPRVYTVKISRELPSTDALLNSVVLMDKDENPLDFTTTFNPSTKIYTLSIPYSIRQVRFEVTPNDPNVARIEIWQGKVVNNSGGESSSESSSSKSSSAPSIPDDGGDGGEAVGGPEPDRELFRYPSATSKYIGDLKLGIPTSATDVYHKTSDYAHDHDGSHPFIIRVWAEDGTSYAEYTVRVLRDEPNHDAALTDLIVKDGENQQLNNFVFHTDMFGCEDGNEEGEERGNDTYYISVPYNTRQVSFIATTRDPYATIEIREEDQSLLARLMSRFFPYPVESGANSRVFNLSEKTGRGNAKEFHFVVRAEDYLEAEDGSFTGTQRTYCLKIYREPPSSDARLKSLVTQNTSDFKPLFISSKTNYTATLNEGAPGIIVIPTANHPAATIKVNGVVVQSGSASDLIEVIEITQTVTIEVTAEDGTTRMVYRIAVTNPNLIEKTANADLKDLKVNYGLMTPEFQAAVTEYEVTTKENLWSVDIIPKLADPLATMRVLNGTRELGDYNGNYAMAIVDGQNDISVEVTSPDGTVTKTYDVAIFKNDEEKLKNLKPLDSGDIDFDHVSNPIIVKIEEYPRVGASVFNTLREEHPDYSIVFQGNDYSIRFDAKNLTRVIPQTEIYDFRMTYASPDEDVIYDHIADYEYNDDIIDDVVMPYFDYHGSLPGPATLSLSLGRFYANDLLYWHYYNRERDRIDYYGTLQSNSQGTIAVSIDHFSTYVVSPEHRIAGSEDKDGVIDEMGMVSNGQDLLGSGGKLNPNTGTKEAT